MSELENKREKRNSEFKNKTKNLYYYFLPPSIGFGIDVGMDGKSDDLWFITFGSYPPSFFVIGIMIGLGLFLLFKLRSKK